ncbi:hypothetical protein [Flavobacterium foetidum]|uniref:hypothetical protein n=1 Tax=Flavobacterium foetidum TaxID=2026681 RepID=UPI001074C643|nr:hypothetical protein [Flavobacterium foetidum]KAF2512595.1 hypothetical protein E0W73_15770 [Flavobacterium foetidum]
MALSNFYKTYSGELGIYCLLLVLFTVRITAQNTKSEDKFEPIFYVNYSVANKSLLTAGLEFCLDCKDENKLFLGAGYGVTNSYNGNYYGLSDLNLSYSKELLFIKTGSSHKNAYALGGFTFLNRFDLGFGYSFPYNNNEKIPAYKGFTTSLTLRLTKNEKAYQKFNMIQ